MQGIGWFFNHMLSLEIMCTLEDALLAKFFVNKGHKVCPLSYRYIFIGAFKEYIIFLGGKLDGLWNVICNDNCSYYIFVVSVLCIFI